jgi:NADPH:quinone reductase-like Zn-dependent oxidoreductase
MPTMKRIQYHQYGGPERMRLEEFTPAAPGKGQVLVRVLAAAANPMDWKIRNGDAKLLTGRRFPRGLGHDFAGVVERAGKGVTRFTAGDAVLGGMMPRPSGAFAEMGVAAEKHIVMKPAGLSYEEAATLPTVGVTALQAVIDKGKLQAGQSVFIAGCLGGVGRIAAQIALTQGASVAGSCRETASQDAKALGIDAVVDFDFDPSSLKDRFDLVLDTAGKLPIEVARTLLKPGGRIVGVHPSLAAMARNVFSRDFKVLIGNWKAKDLEGLAQAAAHGKLNLPIARAVPLTQAIGALTELEEKGTPKGGKLVVTLR